MSLYPYKLLGKDTVNVTYFIASGHCKQEANIASSAAHN